MPHTKCCKTKPSVPRWLAATSTSNTLSSSLHTDSTVLALAVVILGNELALVALADAALPIHELLRMAEQVFTAVVWLDEAKALIIMPLYHLSSACFTTGAMRRSSRG